MVQKNLLKVFALFAVLWISVSGFSGASAESFRVGYFLVKPHAMPAQVNGEAEGVAVEYFKLIAKKMGLEKVEFYSLPLKRLLTELERNNLDMALLFGKNPARESAFVYPESPFCLTRPSVAVAVSHPLAFVRSVEDLLPLRIQESAGANRSPFVRDSRLKFKPLHGNDYTRQCFLKLIHGRIDACYQPDHFPLFFEAQRPLFASKVRILQLPEAAIGLYSVFSKRSAGRYLKSYEKALRETRQEKSYKEVFRAYSRKQQG